MTHRSDFTLAVIGILIALAAATYAIGTASALWVFGAYVLEARVGMITEASLLLMFFTWVALLAAPVVTVGFVRSKP